MLKVTLKIPPKEEEEDEHDIDLKETKTKCIITL